MRNRLHNATNPHQGSARKILCVCSAGLLRSPSLAYHLSTLGYNTRAVGSSQDFALIPIDEVLIHWADEIIYVNEDNKIETEKAFDTTHKTSTVFNIPDMYGTRDPQLMKLIAKECEEHGY